MDVLSGRCRWPDEKSVTTFHCWTIGSCPSIPLTLPINLVEELFSIPFLAFSYCTSNAEHKDVLLASWNELASDECWREWVCYHHQSMFFIA